MTDKTVSLTDLNTADEEALARKLQVSPRLARRIIALRPYKSVEELNRVWGLDPAVLQRILIGEIRLKTLSKVAKVRELPLNRSEMGWKYRSRVPRTFASASKAEKASWQTSVLLVLILLVGAYFRFTGLNWDERTAPAPGRALHLDGHRADKGCAALPNISIPRTVRSIPCASVPTPTACSRCFSRAWLRTGWACPIMTR